MLGFRDVDTRRCIVRKLTPLRKIRDNYEKIVLAGECDNPVTQDGIKIVRLTDFCWNECGGSWYNKRKRDRLK